MEGGFTLLKQGAEAKLYKGTYLNKPTIAKERFSKKYRHSALDATLTKDRIKSEARSILRCKQAGIRTPAIYLVDFARSLIFMEYFENSMTLKEFIEQSDMENVTKISLEIGHMLGKMHKANIIHGDLTSSNMLIANHSNSINDVQLVLIDFGLSYLEKSFEDKAVDLYVLERALQSTHTVADVIFRKIMDGYRKENSAEYKGVMVKLEDVRSRGRKRAMVG